MIGIEDLKKGIVILDKHSPIEREITMMPDIDERGFEYVVSRPSDYLSIPRTVINFKGFVRVFCNNANFFLKVQVLKDNYQIF